MVLSQTTIPYDQYSCRPPHHHMCRCCAPFGSSLEIPAWILPPHNKRLIEGSGQAGTSDSFFDPYALRGQESRRRRPRGTSRAARFAPLACLPASLHFRGAPSCFLGNGRANGDRAYRAVAFSGGLQGSPLFSHLPLDGSMFFFFLFFGANANVLVWQT